jgi:TetR/AcrR family transcriptional repressor of nem operon
MKASPGRPLEFDPEVALTAAMQLFWRKGYENTSMQDLLDAMQLSKSSLYQAFGGKRQLFERCIEVYGDFIVGQMRAALSDAPSGVAFIRFFLESVLDEARGISEARGCLVLNTANEFSRRDPRISEVVASGLGRFHAILSEAVRRAQREGDIPRSREPVMLANYLVNSMSGLKTLSKAGADESSLRGIIEVVMKALK